LILLFGVWIASETIQSSPFWGCFSTQRLGDFQGHVKKVANFDRLFN